MIKITLITIALFMASSCGKAEFGYSGALSEPPTKTNETITLPQGSPPDTGTGGGIEPPPLTCDKQILLHVDHVEIQEVDAYGIHRSRCGQAGQGTVDLCALSKDFVGTLAQSLHLTLPKGTRLSNVRLVLDSKNDHQVLSAHGTFICNLRVPPGPDAGVFFTAQSLLTIDAINKIIFPLNQSSAYHDIGNGDCQLSPPTGHFDLISVPKI